MTDYLTSPVHFNAPGVVSAMDEMSYWSARFASLIFDNLELASGINVLDVACGAGCPLFELANMLGSSCQLTGIDTWPQALDRAAEKLRVYGLNNAHLIRTEGDTFPLPDAHFDLIVCNLGLNNFENPGAVLAECARVARLGARAAFTTNVVGHMQEFYAVYRQVLIDSGHTAYLSRLTAQEEHRGTRVSHITLLEQAGFRVSKVIEDAFFLRYRDGSTMLRHWFIRLGFLNGWRSVVQPSDEVAIFERLETGLNALAAEQGELKMTIPMLYLECVKI